MQDKGILSGVVMASLSSEQTNYTVLLSLYHTWVYANNNNNLGLCKILIDLLNQLTNIDDDAHICGVNFEDAFMCYEQIQCYTDACYNDKTQQYELQPLNPNAKLFTYSLKSHYNYPCFKPYHILPRV